MSRAWSWRNAILASRLQATTKHVLMVVSTHMNDMGGGCYPSIKTIAELASLSERSVCTHIEVAAAAGWLEVQKHGFNGQGWARHEYKPLWPEGAERGSVRQGTEPDDKKALNVVQSIELPNEHPSEVLSAKPKPTKATPRANPGIRLAVFLANASNIEGAMPIGWEQYPGVDLRFTPAHIERCWRAFHRYFTGPDCSKPLKRDWHRAWENWCDREAQNGRGGGGSGGKTDGGLAAAMRASVASRYGASQPDGRFGGGNAAGTTSTDGSGAGSPLKPGDVAF